MRAERERERQWTMGRSAMSSGSCCKPSISTDYAIGVIRGEDHFGSIGATFSRNSLLAGEALEPSFDFEVRLTSTHSMNCC